MLATGSSWPFGVNQPLTTVLSKFNAQGLLRASLCASEDLTVSMVASNATNKIDLPGGIAGQHALFAILENFARNSAKHSHRRNPEPGGSKITTVRLSLEVAESERATDLLLCTLADKDAAPVAEAVLRKMQASANQSLLDEVAWLDPKLAGLGVPETKIWAAHLSGHMCEDASSPPISYIPNSSGQLALQFHLRKASDPVETTHIGAVDFDRKRDSGGRWLEWTEQGSDVRFKTRFASITAPANAWLDLKNGDNEKRQVAALAAHVETLRRFVHSGLPRHLSLFVVDNGAFLNMQSHQDWSVCDDVVKIKVRLLDVDAYIAPEELGETEATRLERLLKVAPAGDVAIWWRHDIDLSALPASLTERVIHSEICRAPHSESYRYLFVPGAFDDESAATLLFGALAEAALVQGRLIDERFARLFEPGSRQRISAEWAGIHIVDPYTPGFEDLGNLVANVGNDYRSAGQADLRLAFESIHASLKRNHRLMRTTTWEDFIEGQRTEYPILALHSGAGRSEEMSANALPFFPESLYHNWAFSDPCKLFLADALVRGRGIHSWTGSR